MATWTTIPDSSLEPGKPIRSIDTLALRDNPVAIAEGAPGAPRVASDSAIDWGGGGVGETSAVNWVGAKNSLLSAGAIGSFAFAVRSTGTGLVTFGSTLAGSSLTPTGIASGGVTASGGTLTGTWRCLGRSEFFNPQGNTLTLWLRIA
jgi:hypothetical protein